MATIFRVFRTSISLAITSSAPCDLSNAKKLYIDYLGEISYNYYKLIEEKATELGIYTTELSYPSKAIKLFYSQNTDEIYESIRLESIAVKELIVFYQKQNHILVSKR